MEVGETPFSWNGAVKSQETNPHLSPLPLGKGRGEGEKEEEALWLNQPDF